MEKLKMQESEADFSGELKDLESEIMNQAEKKTYRWVMLDPDKEYKVCDNPLTKEMGTKVFEWHKETYYTSNKKVKPHFDINKTAHPVPGVHIAWWDGTVRDEYGYIVIACNGKKFGDIVMTSRWPWKVYDRWWMKRKDHVDIFTNR